MQTDAIAEEDVNTQEIAALIATGREHEFYAGAEWKHMAAMVRRYDSNECQLCKQRGRYRRGEIVHHVKHLKERPDLALRINDPDTGQRQLITVCKKCHEEQHPEALMVSETAKHIEITAERWD